MSSIVKTTNTNIVALDLGNSMMKGARYLSNGEIFKVALANKIELEDNHNTEDCRCIEYNGRKMYIGVGKLNNNTLKHTRKNLLEQALVMICELYPNQYEIRVEQLRLGLPAEHTLNKLYVESLKEKFITNKWLEFTIGGVKKRVFIEKVGVCVEGYSAYINIKEKIDVEEDILIVDVGGGTTDLCAFHYKNQKYIVGKVHTIDTGVIALTEKIADSMNKAIGSDFTSDKIDDRLKENRDTILYKTQHKISDYIETIETTIEAMIDSMTNRYGELHKYFIVGIGGGYATFDKLANKHISASVQLDNETRFYANVEGFLKQ